MPREIVLDTETTGFEPHLGHRLVELAALEIEDFLPTGRTFHAYIDPERDMPVEAERVHGLSAAFLKGKPRFADPEIAQAFLDFVGEAPLVAHNAAFDRAFLNWELGLAGLPDLPEARWVDTLALARRRFPGMQNSLDALCKRFRVSLTEREKHGALVDARLLASVYLELSGGRERALELTVTAATSPDTPATLGAHGHRPRPLAPRSSDAERAAHANFVLGAVKSELWKAWL